MTAASPVEGRDPAELLAALAPRVGPERLLDLMLRTGPFGDGFGADPDGVTLAALEAAPHGIDLGAAAAAHPRGAAHARAGRSSWRRALVAGDVPRLRARLDDGAGGGRARPHRPPPAALEQLVDAQPAEARQRAGALHGARPPARRRAPRPRRRRGGAGVAARTARIELSAQVTDDMMPGVVSIPHGWGHDLDGAVLDVAREHAGVNVNLLGDAGTLEPLTGTAVLNGIPVTVAPA